MTEWNNYWIKIAISFFLISSIFLIKEVNNFFNNLYLFDKLDIYLSFASITGVFFSIFFSIVLVAVQHSATNYLPSILGRFRKDKKLIFIVIVSMLSIFLNLFLYLSGISYLLVLSLLIFLISFLSIIFYFYEMLNFLNPLFIVENLKKEILMRMEKLRNKMIKQSKKEISGTGLEKFPALAQEVKLNSKEYREKNIEEINKLFSHIGRSNAINDFETYKHALECLSQIVENYLSNKKIDSQQDEFMEYVLTKLKLQANFLIRNNEPFKVIEIIATLKKIGISSLNKLQVLHFGGLNYITSLICYYIEEIGATSAECKNLDLTKECIVALKNIGIVSINKNLTTTMTESNITKLAVVDGWFIYHNSLGAINQLLIELIINIPKKEHLKKILPEQDMYTLIKNQAKIINSTVTKSKTSLEIASSLSPAFGPLSEVSLLNISKGFIYLSQNPPVELATHNYETMSKKFIEDLLEHQKEIIKNAKQTKSSILLGDYTEFLCKLIIELNNNKLKTYKDGFKEEIESVLGILFECSNNEHSYMFKDKIDSLLNELEKDKKKNKEIINKIKELSKSK
jgi:hypothetical protein